MDHMYIRHAVGGRLFYDSAKDGSFRLHREEEDWVFTIHPADPVTADRLLPFREELNILLVPEGSASHKSWFYTATGRVEYDSAANRITIYADVRHDYTV